MTTLSLEKITKSYAQTPVLLDVNVRSLIAQPFPQGSGELLAVFPRV